MKRGVEGSVVSKPCKAHPDKYLDAHKGSLMMQERAMPCSGLKLMVQERVRPCSGLKRIVQRGP